MPPFRMLKNAHYNKRYYTNKMNHHLFLNWRGGGSFPICKKFYFNIGRLALV